MPGIASSLAAVTAVDCNANQARAWLENAWLSSCASWAGCMAASMSLASSASGPRFSRLHAVQLGSLLFRADQRGRAYPHAVLALGAGAQAGATARCIVVGRALP